MKARILRSLWTNGFDLNAALADCATGIYDGIEGPLPEALQSRTHFISRIAEAKLPFVAEIATGGGYVPSTRSVADHRCDLQKGLVAAAEAGPLLATVLGGCDSWTVGESVEFLGHGMQLAAELGVEVSFETHRSRVLFHPWIAADILRQLPNIGLTCDFSHWCCVCERCVLDEDENLLGLIAKHARHVHARIGYAQGPQVPHPAAPAYARELAAHERWWMTLWRVRRSQGFSDLTFTPEFGPDGYQQTHPFTGRPAASLDEMNRWIAIRLRNQFEEPAANPQEQVFHV